PSTRQIEHSDDQTLLSVPVSVPSVPVHQAPPPPTPESNPAPASMVQPFNDSTPLFRHPATRSDTLQTNADSSNHPSIQPSNNPRPSAFPISPLSAIASATAAPLSTIPTQPPGHIPVFHSFAP